MTTHAVLFPDAEQVTVTGITDVLAELGDTTSVTNKVPNPRPTQFVRAFRTGGTRKNLVTDNPLMTVEAWADTDAEAADLAARCRYAVTLMRGRTIHGAVIYRIEEAGGPVNLPDPESGQHRYTFTSAIAMRGAKPT